jgi:hypothetical protein
MAGIIAWLRKQWKEWDNALRCSRIELGYSCTKRKCLGREEH